MRKWQTKLVRTAAIAAAFIPASGWAHPGHGDTAHYFLGGAHAGPDAHELLASPLFAVALLIVSAGVLCAGTLRARARSLKLPRPRRTPGSALSRED